jgi:hypothetical protein
MNNGHSMMAEYEVQQKSMEVDLNPTVGHTPVNISFK